MPSVISSLVSKERSSKLLEPTALHTPSMVITFGAAACADTPADARRSAEAFRSCGARRVAPWDYRTPQPKASSRAHRRPLQPTTKSDKLSGMVLLAPLLITLCCAACITRSYTTY